MRIGQLAESAGVTVQAIRFYERCGLLPVPHRLPSGYRKYSAEALRTIKLIKQMQGLGFSLRELKHFIQMLETEPHNPTERRAYVEAKLQSIDEQICRLREIRDELSTRLLTCECCNAPPVNIT